MELRGGGAVRLWFRHANLTPAWATPPERYADAVRGMEMLGRVTRCEPPRLLAYTWDESEVCFELTPQGDDVRLTLTHSRLASRAESSREGGRSR